MTEKLYYKDAYIKQFEAEVLSSEKCGNGYRIILDKTAFFPNEGGQYSDRGYIMNLRVIDVREENGIIYHYTDLALKTGELVECKLDFEERFDKMQQHTAEHILSGIIHTLYGFDNVGFHLGPDEVTMDVSAPMDAQMIARVEREANLAVFGNLPVEAFFPTEKELENITYRSKSELTENIRIVTVAGVDSCACCAPHVKSTGEIGLIKILKRESLRGGVRLWIAAGERAYRDYIERARETERISALLSAPVNEVFSAVNAQNESFKELKADNRRLEAALTERIADGFVYTEGNAVLYLPELSIDALRSLSKLILDKVSGVLVLLCGKEGDFKYVLSSKSSDLRVAIKDYNSALGGKGGGRSEMVQGSFTATLEEIKKYFK